MDSLSEVVTDMLPGSYLVSSIAKDKMGRESDESETRQVLVPNISEVGAPKSWNIKIE